MCTRLFACVSRMLKGMSNSIRPSLHSELVTGSYAAFIRHWSVRRTGVTLGRDESSR